MFLWVFFFLTQISAESQQHCNCKSTELLGRTNKFWMNILVISDIIHFRCKLNFSN